MKAIQLFVCATSMLVLTNISTAQEIKKEPAKRNGTRLSEDYYIPQRFLG